MAKLKNPFFSFSAQGALGKAITFVTRRGTHIAESTPVVPDAKTLAQLSWRHMFQKVVALWHALSAAEKLEWESLARPHHMTGYAWFISQCLKPNPGIYLPLQGGTMSGDINMDKNRLLKLPAPSDTQEAATKAYVDALIAPPTKEFFVTAGAHFPQEGRFVGHGRVTVLLDTVNDFAHTDFWVPHDFTSIIEAVIVCMWDATHANTDLDLQAIYSAVGELWNAHIETDNVTTYNFTANTVKEIDISGVLTNLAAGDHVGINIKLATDPGNLLYIWGVRFKYA